MTLDEVFALCQEHDLADVEIVEALLDPWLEEDPLGAIERATARCHLCLERQGIERGADGLWWCTDLPRCMYRARLRLGIPRKGGNGHPGASDFLRDDLARAGRRPGVVGVR